MLLLLRNEWTVSPRRTTCSRDHIRTSRSISPDARLISHLASTDLASRLAAFGFSSENYNLGSSSPRSQNYRESSQNGILGDVTPRYSVWQLHIHATLPDTPPPNDTPPMNNLPPNAFHYESPPGVDQWLQIWTDYILNSYLDADDFPTILRQRAVTREPATPPSSPIECLTLECVDQEQDSVQTEQNSDGERNRQYQQDVSQRDPEYRQIDTHTTETGDDELISDLELDDSRMNEYNY